MTYFVVKGSEDGTNIAVLDDERQLKTYLEDCGVKRFRDEMSDPNYWPEDTALIIKGEIIVPKPKTIVTEWEF